MSRTSQNTGDETASHTEQLKQSTSELGGHLREIGTHAKGAAGEALHQAKDVASEKYGKVRDAAGEYYEQGREKVGEYQGQLETYVREQPIKALLIAAGAGLVLGAIWKRL